MNYRCRFAAFVCAVALTPSAVAFAATVTVGPAPFTMSNTSSPTGSLFLGGFDTSLGTLTGVIFDLSLSEDAHFFISNPNPAAYPYANVYASYPLTIVLPSGLEFSETITANSGPGTMHVGSGNTFHLLGTDAWSQPDSGLSSYEGAGAKIYSLQSQNPVIGVTFPPGGAGRWIPQAGVISMNGALSVTYTYTPPAPPAAPEPATWALMGFGFAALGLAGWRARRPAT